MLLETQPADVEVVYGTPAELNRALAAGEIDLAPCSSIEYARHADRYRILPGLAIGSFGPVRSILLESTAPLEALDGSLVAVPTASATSVALLRILLQSRFGVQPALLWYAQEDARDPIEEGAAAALRIGDLALRRQPPHDRSVYDLGALWCEWTGLPFAFALWQTPLPPSRDAELMRLADQLRAWRQHSRLNQLAERYAARVGISPTALEAYWRGLRYDLDSDMIQGVERFFELAAASGDVMTAPPLRFVT